MRAIRGAVAFMGVLLLAWIGWTLVQATRADYLAQTDPEAALRIDPDHPQALLREGCGSGVGQSLPRGR